MSSVDHLIYEFPCDPVWVLLSLYYDSRASVFLGELVAYKVASLLAGHFIEEAIRSQNHELVLKWVNTVLMDLRFVEQIVLVLEVSKSPRYRQTRH